MTEELPIHAVIPQLIAAVNEAATTLLIAPPGAGKTTIVPGALLDAQVISGTVLLVQPRRVAAIMVARRIAKLRGSNVGEEVGYHIRFDKRVGKNTKIIVLTEGILLRRLQSDPFLEGVDAVLLDEFHERSINSDLALALLTEVQRDARPSLKLLIMSATLDPKPLQAWLPGTVPVIQSDGRCYPVEIIWGEPADKRRVEVRTAAAVRDALQCYAGDVLAFLPGAGWIHSTAELLTDLVDVDVFTLYGSLPPSQQERALAVGRRRRVVLSTNLAESSVTVQGVTAVVDSGLQNQPKYLSKLGTTRLETIPISRASAEQRAGRAGRVREGVCYRLWSQNTPMRSFDKPEIERTDLAATILQVYAWGSTPNEFGWFSRPTGATVVTAEQLLTSLGALQAGRITPLGAKIADLPLHPRLGRVVIEGHAQGVLAEAAQAAALISEQDPWPNRDADLFQRLQWLATGERAENWAALSRVHKVANQIIAAMPDSKAAYSRDVGRILTAIIAGFPDRIAQRRPGQRHAYLLSSGTGARIERTTEPEALILATRVTGTKHSARNEVVIREWLPLNEDDLHPTIYIHTHFEPVGQRVVIDEEHRIGALVLRSRRLSDKPDPRHATDLLIEAAESRLKDALNYTEDLEHWLARLRFLSETMPELELPTPPTSKELLADIAVGRTSMAQLHAVNLLEHIKGTLPWSVVKQIDKLAPTHLALPSGGDGRITYPEEGTPYLSARIQQIFGMTTTPCIANGKIPLLVHLLAPNNRPAQITGDLANFWMTTYPEIRKEMRGRYPKHAWPESPTASHAQNRPNRRKPRQ
jgi:ATP-dependent helicase HrpB